MLGSERDLVAKTLFLALIGRQMQPSLRREITSNSFVENCFFEKVAISKRESQNQGCLSLADSL